MRLSESLADLDTKSSTITSGTLTVDKFKWSQQLDSKIQVLWDSMGDKLSPKYLEKQGVLCKEVGNDFLPILPQSLEKFLFSCEHFHVTAGHRSATAMIADLKAKFSIHNMKQKVMQFCKDCYI